MTTITGFGRDTWFGPQGLRTGRFASGRVLLAWALYRRLITPRGTLRGGDDEANYGIDIADYVGAMGTVAAVAMLPGLVQGELSKDERVASVSALTPTTATDSAGLVHIFMSVDVTPTDEGGTFRLTLDVTDAAVLLAGVST